MSDMPQPFNMIFTLARLQGIKVVIAGGAAACYEKADDIDVWVQGDGGRAEGYRFLDTLGPAVVGDMDTNRDAVGYGPNQLLGTRHPAWSPKPIQVIETAYHTTQDLLDSFDLSTHAVAIDSAGHRIYGKHFTTLTEKIVVGRAGNAGGYGGGMFPSTRRRLRKLKKRYDLTLFGRLKRYLKGLLCLDSSPIITTATD